MSFFTCTWASGDIFVLALYKISWILASGEVAFQPLLKAIREVTAFMLNVEGQRLDVHNELSTSNTTGISSIRGIL